MSILFQRIEASFPPQAAFHPLGGLWVYSYSFPETFEPDAVSNGSQGVEFRALAEREGGENVSRLEVEFRLSADNFRFLLQEMEEIRRELRGEVSGLSCFVYRHWPAVEKPFWIRDPASANPYMVWHLSLGRDDLDLDRLMREMPLEGEFFSGVLEIAFPVVEEAGMAEAASSPGREDNKGVKSVLLVDDNDATLNLLQVILRTEFQASELDFIPCNSGAEAFNQALERRPNLILLDLMMPEKGGFEVLEELRKHPDTRDIPVVILSVIYDEESVSRANTLGVERYLVKPFVPYDVTRVIREIVFQETPEP
jgi:CheY-like chemotaxis protein